MRKTSLYAAKVGKAYRADDGIVRWVVGLSRQGNYSLLWRDNDGIWNSGGRVAASEWQGGIEVPAPQSGDTYRVYTVFGNVREVTL